MFQRRASQKPNDQFYKTFKAAFPQLNNANNAAALPPSSSSAVVGPQQHQQPPQRQQHHHQQQPPPPPSHNTVRDELDADVHDGHADDDGDDSNDALRHDANMSAADHAAAAHSTDLKNQEQTPRATMDGWNFPSSGFTPAMLDPTSHAFNMFANQMPGYYTPTPGGTTLYHPQAGDLHTPGFSLGLNTPLSLPNTSEGILHPAQHLGHLPSFHHHGHLPQGGQTDQQQQPFQNLNPFHLHHQNPPQAAYPPQHFTNAHATFDPQQHHHRQDDIGVDDSPTLAGAMDLGAHDQTGSPELLFNPNTFKGTMAPPPPLNSSAERFRFHTTLNAPTAMIKNADEIPITYLNKGQAYTLNVVDTAPPPQQHGDEPKNYRTFVRVSFEDEEQRQKPATCWQLWKEGRGTNEAHQRGGRLQAVEFVDPTQVSGTEDPSKPVIELEAFSFDGFCIRWTPSSVASAECPIAVRFNFLSTDFSHSKGVKGIPVRLCAKTELLASPSPVATSPPVLPSAEICYCKVKLFRDHGAERKLSNDVQHVRKNIDKLSQQIAQIESGVKDFGKRKRSGSTARGAGYDHRPGKVVKHKRTWSTASMGTSGGGGAAARSSVEDDLHVKLASLQDMFSSTRPASVLHLRGSDQDDPDLFPVKLAGEGGASLARNDSADTSGWDRRSNTGPPSSLVSPSLSSKSLIGSRRQSGMQQPTPFGPESRMNSNEWRSHPQTALSDLHNHPAPRQLASPPDGPPVKIKTIGEEWIEAAGVEENYEPPDRKVKPVACFYVLPRADEAVTTGKTDLYRAVYLMQRTLADFSNSVAVKCNIAPTQVQRVVRITGAGLCVLFDNDCVRELPEGQDMIVEVRETQLDPAPKLKREWDAGATDVQCDGDIPVIADVSTIGFELRLHF